MRRKLVDSREPSGIASDDPVWTRLRELVRAVNGSTLLDGRLINSEDGKPDGTGLVFTMGQTRSIPHKLGRPAVGFLEVYGADTPSVGHVGLCAATHPKGMTSEFYVTLTATTAGRCFVWVF